MNDKHLLDLAEKAAKNSYAPYSRINIGAALLAGNGKIYLGSNVENSSYGLTICAERSAVINAIASEGVRDFEAMAVYSDSLIPSPCGACAQFIAEFAPELKLVIGSTGKSKVLNISDILPNPFRLSHE